MIKIYSTKTCPWCVRAKEYLSTQGINYTELDVSSDYSAAKEMIEKSGQRGVPVLEINGHIIVGFDKERIDSLLKDYIA